MRARMGALGLWDATEALLASHPTLLEGQLLEAVRTGESSLSWRGGGPTLQCAGRQGVGLKLALQLRLEVGVHLLRRQEGVLLGHAARADRPQQQLLAQRLLQLGHACAMSGV